MNENSGRRETAPLVHGRMLYRCECCGESWYMYLEKGIEEFGENHKPSPFTIECPYCGGCAMDVSGIQKIPGGYIPLPDGGNYFANMKNKKCGVPVFCAERLRESEMQALIADAVKRLFCAERLQESETQALIADAEECLKRREMEMCMEAMREEQARTEEITGRTAADTGKAIRKTAVILAGKTGTSLEKAAAMISEAIREFGFNLKAVLSSLLEEPDLTAPEPGELLDDPTVWEREEMREKRQIAERAAASRFRQYKTKENTWVARKRTGPRQREWRGPWREGKN